MSKKKRIANLENQYQGLYTAAMSMNETIMGQTEVIKSLWDVLRAFVLVWNADQSHTPISHDIDIHDLRQRLAKAFEEMKL